MRRAHQPSWRRTRRTGVVAVAALAATIAWAGAGHAQTEPVGNGTATAIAGVARYAPGVGQLALGATNGTAISKVTNDLAQATAQSTDLGLIGSSLTSEGCDGEATITPDQLPQPTFTDNRNGDASEVRDESGTQDAPAGVGRMFVEAFEDPVAANAEATMGAFGLAPIIEVGGGKSTAIARVLPGEGREAIATAVADVALADGLVEFAGMQWFAQHRTGVETIAQAGFRIGSGTVGGVPVPLEEIAQVEATANEVLAPLGLRLDFPEVERLTDGSDLIRVSPLRIELRDTPVGKLVFGPVLEATREQRLQLFDELTTQICDLAGVLLVADIAVSVVAGTGFLVLEVGGARATSSDLEVFDPFGDLPTGTGGAAPSPSGAAPSVDVPTPQPASAPGAAGVVSPAVSTPAAATTPAPGATPLVTQPARVTPGAIEEVCESVHPNRSPSCSTGAVAAVGVLGLLATVGAAGLDVRRRRQGEVPAQPSGIDA